MILVAALMNTQSLSNPPVEVGRDNSALVSTTLDLHANTRHGSLELYQDLRNEGIRLGSV